MIISHLKESCLKRDILLLQGVQLIMLLHVGRWSGVVL